MAQMMDIPPQKYEGERFFWNCVKENLPDDCICYVNREAKGGEYDVCLLIKNVCLVIVEVKGWAKSHIRQVKSPDEIVLNGKDYELSRSPKKQARNYLFKLANLLLEKYDINPLILDMVCYPFLSEDDYTDLRLDVVSDTEHTLFREDITSQTNFCRKILSLYNDKFKENRDNINDTVYNIIRSHFEPQMPRYDKMKLRDVRRYSEVRICDQKLSLDSINKISEQYFSGIKQIVFVSDYDDLEMLAGVLSDGFKHKNLNVNTGSLEIKHSATVKLEIKRNQLRFFNFEAYFIPDKTIVTPVEIINGVTNSENEELLLTLSELSAFNYQQYKIEHAPVGKDIYVKAGAGTGKTYSMVSRIGFLYHIDSDLEKASISDQIAMLTFTSDAALNMKTRLKKLFENYFLLTGRHEYMEMISNVERMHISTIHKFAEEIIKKTSTLFGLGTVFSTTTGIYERRMISEKLLNEYLMKKNAEHPDFVQSIPIPLLTFRKNILDIASSLYEKGCDVKEITPDMIGAHPSDIPCMEEIFNEIIIQTEKEFTKQQLENNSVSLNEYMVYLNRSVRSDFFNSQLFKFKYIFVDEFQDTDDAQIFALIAMQEKIGFNFFIVGDLKQSIYRFRGATMDAFNKMGCKHENWLMFTLNVNYRTDERVLEKYDTLFRSLGKSNMLPYVNGEDSLIGVKQNKAYSDSDVFVTVEYHNNDIKSGQYYNMLFNEIAAQYQKISDLSQKENLTAAERTIAILVRYNKEINNITKEANKRQVLIETDSNGNLYQMPSTVDLCKLTAALCNPHNPTYLYTLLQSNNIGITVPVNELYQKSKEEKISVLTDYLDQFYTNIMNKTWKELIYEVQHKPVLKMLRLIYEYSQPWKMYSKEDEKQALYRNNYELVFEQLSSLNKKNYLTLESINSGLHINITAGMKADAYTPVTDNNNVRVICTTVHRSKGLEYGTVILPFTVSQIDSLKKGGVNTVFYNNKVGYCLSNEDSQYPSEYYSIKQETNDAICEEARILYVALTRAINNFIWFENLDSQKSNLSWGALLGDM